MRKRDKLHKSGGSVYCDTKASVKALSDGLRIDLVDTSLRVTNIKPGMVETNFSVIRFRSNKDKADNVYKGIRPLIGCFFNTIPMLWLHYDIVWTYLSISASFQHKIITFSALRNTFL